MVDNRDNEIRKMFKKSGNGGKNQIGVLAEVQSAWNQDKWTTLEAGLIEDTVCLRPIPA